MSRFTPAAEFDYYYKACRKGDPGGKAVAVNQSPVAALADASEITGLPRDNFEVHEISKAEFDALHSHTTADCFLGFVSAASKAGTDPRRLSPDPGNRPNRAGHP